MPSGAGCPLRWNDFVSTSRRHPLYNALSGTLVSEVNFTDWSNPCQKCFKGRLGNLVKFTFRADPHQKGFRGTLVSKVNFTGRGNPCQKYLRGRFDDLVKFTFGATLARSTPKASRAL